MSYQYDIQATSNVPDIIDTSDSEDMESIMAKDIRQEEIVDRRLGQALNYLRSEGDSDSPATFIDRVNRIDRVLLQRLCRSGHSFDRDLYHQVRTMVSNVRQDFNDAAGELSSEFEGDEVTPEGFVPIEALYRGESSSPSPTPLPSTSRALDTRAPGPRRQGIDGDVQRSRVFKYGGPDNEAEHWHSNAPPSLPFPETHLMAHWESLKIDYDLSRPKDAKHTETNVPFNHPALQSYLNLPQYESGSRFRLPAVSAEDQNAISRYGTSTQLTNAVDQLNKLDASENGVEDYTPRVFLEKFRVGSQKFPTIVSPSRLREAMAFTPSKSRTNKVTNHAAISAIDLPISTPRAEKVPVTKTRIAHGKVHTSPAFRRISNEVRLAERADARAEKATNKTTSTTPTKPKSPRVAVPFANKSKINRKLTTLPPTNREPKPLRVATHVVIPKRGRGRPRKDAATVVPTTPITATPIDEPSPTTLGKRKPSIGSQPYHDPTTTSSIKKILRDRAAKKQKLAPVEVAGLVVEAPITLEDDPADPLFVVSPVKKLVRARAKKVANVAEEKGKPKGRAPSKATVAGKLAKGGGAKKVEKQVQFKNRGENVGRGTTRSGMVYTI